MKILVVNCSPVRNGATARIVELIGSYTAPGNEVRQVCIDDYAIRLCRGCRICHQTARCIQPDGAEHLMDEFAWADRIVCVAPSYWADVPGQFKVFIDRCTPWCNTHEPHATIPAGKRGWAVALRTGPGMHECERIIATIEHFYGHLEVACSGKLGLCGVSCRDEVAPHEIAIAALCEEIVRE